MKKILILCPSLGVGGAERVATRIASSLVEKDYNVIFAYYLDVEIKYEISSKVKLLKLDNFNNQNKLLSLMKKLFVLKSIIKNEKPDYILPFLLDYNVFLLSFITKVKFLSNIRNNPNKSSSKIRKFLNKIACYKSNAILIQNEEQKHFFSKILQKKCFIMPNPISEEFFYKEKKYNDKIESIIAVGRLRDRQKNFMMLIKAFANVRKKYNYLELHIYGEGESRELYEEYIKENNIYGITLEGRVSNIADVLCKHDLFIMTSNYEGQPNALLEACAIGLPCISTNCETGPKEIIKDGVNGILINVGNQVELENKIEFLICNNEIATQLGKNAHKEIIENYTIENTIDGLEKALKFVECKNKKSRRR